MSEPRCCRGANSLIGAAFVLPITMAALWGAAGALDAQEPGQVELDTLRITWVGYNPVPDSTYQAYATYLEKALGRPVRYLRVPRWDYAAMARQMDANTLPQQRIDIGMFTPYTYIAAKTLNPGILPIATYASQQRIDYNSAFVWRPDPGLGTFEQVIDTLVANQSHKLAIADVNSTSGFQVPSGWLLSRRSIDLRSDVALLVAGSHLDALKSLQADSRVIAAVVADAVYDNYPEKDAFRKFTIPLKLPHGAATLRPGLSQDVRRRVQSVLLKMDGEPEGKALMERYYADLSYDRWLPVNDHRYDGIRALVRSVFPAVTLHLSITNKSEVSTRELTDSLSTITRDGWARLSNDSNGADVIVNLAVSGPPTALTAVLALRTGSAEASAITSGPTLETLVNRVRSTLQRELPVRAYVSELDTTGSSGVLVEVGSRRGLKPGMSASITKMQDRHDQEDPPAVLATIRARVVEVADEHSRIMPLGRVTWTNVIRLDPFDKFFYLVRVPGEQTAPPPDSITIDLEDVIKEGVVLKVPFRVRLLRDGEPARAGEAGWALHVAARGASKLGAPPGAAEHNWFLDLGEWTLLDTLLLSASPFAPEIVVTARDGGKVAAKKVPLWVGLRLMQVVLIVGAVTSLLRYLHQQIGKEQPATWKKHLVQLPLTGLVGAGSAALLYVLVAGLPELLRSLQGLSEAMQTFFGQLAIGVVGGLGSFALLKKIVDKLGL